MADIPFREVREGDDESDYDEEGRNLGSWMICKRNGNRFEGACDPSSLPRVLSTFLDWVIVSRA